MNAAQEVRRDIELMQKHLPVLDKLVEVLGDEVAYWYWKGGVTVSGLSRKDLLNGVKNLALGKWVKDFESSGSLVYRTTLDNLQIELKTRELPNTCKLVKKLVQHPAREAYTTEEFAIECHEPKEEEAPVE